MPRSVPHWFTVATIPVTIPDAVAPRVLTAICTDNGWRPASGKTKLEFLQAWINRQLKNATLEYESRVAAEAAAAAARATVEAEFVEPVVVPAPAPVTPAPPDVVTEVPVAELTSS